MANLKIQELNGAVVFTTKIVPGSSKTTVSGLLNGMLKLKIAAPPEKSKANKCLIELLATKLGVKTKDVSIISGNTRPIKKVKITGISAKTLMKKLNLAKGPA